MIYFIYDPAYPSHQTGPWHPEQPARVTSIEKILTSNGLKTNRNSLQPRMATEQEILLCHTKPYFDLVRQEVLKLQPNEITSLSTGDVIISPNSLNAALLAAGGVLTAIDQVMTEQGATAFCNIRPPGHHATSSCGMGFCLFNNAAIGARYAQQKYGVNRIAIIDWDVHHGNGTQEIFYSDPSVFYFSTHEKGLYPGTGMVEETGEGKGKGYTRNCPIDPGPGSRLKVIEAFENILQEHMRQFQPELILISAGFDGHQDDPLGHFNLIEEDFFTLTQIVKNNADRYAKGRIVSVLEGGYNLNALSLSVLAHIKGLTQEK